jgi:hypothetical protein
MSDEAPEQPEEADLRDEIEEAAERVGVTFPPTFLWDINPHDILHLLNKSPFLQIVDTKVNLDAPEEEPELILSESGWQIYDYGNALSTSPGLLLFGGGDFRMPTDEDDDDAGSGGGIVNPGKGTLVNQAFLTAVDMVRIADERLWEGLMIVDGNPQMQWAAWAEAYDRGFVVEGYEVTDKDYEKRRRIRRTEEEVIELREEIRMRSRR